MPLVKKFRSSTSNFDDKPFRKGRPLVGGLSFRGVSGLCTNSRAHVVPAGTQAQGMRPMQAWASCSGVGQLAMGGAQCSEQRGPDLERSETKQNLSWSLSPSHWFRVLRPTVCLRLYLTAWRHMRRSVAFAARSFFRRLD